MKFISFKSLTGISSLAIAGCAAYFSVYGIGLLFSGAAISAMIMASTLEIGKLVATSYLYRYWKETNKLLKFYLILSVFSLMLITSFGIFGYLSSAYQQSSVSNSITTASINALNEQKQMILQRIDFSKSRILSISQLRNAQENRLSQTMTNVMLTRNASQFKQIQAQTEELISQTDKNIDAENIKIQSLNEEIAKIDDSVIKLKLEAGSKKDIQTFTFIANEFGGKIDTVAKWFIICLIFVFDPLAICLLLAYNTMLFSEHTKNKMSNVNSGSAPVDRLTNTIKEEMTVPVEPTDTTSTPDVIDASVAANQQNVKKERPYTYSF